MRTESQQLIRKSDQSIYELRKYIRELEKENDELMAKLEVFNQQKTKFMSTAITSDWTNLIGRTIKAAIRLKKDSYWNNDYLGFICEDGTRVAILGNASTTIRLPNLSSDKMIESGFYTEEEISQALKYEESERLRREENKRLEKERELKRLQEELGLKEEEE